MAKPIAADYTTVFLFPPSLEDMVPLDHPARFIRQFVDSLNLAELGFSLPACTDGRPPFDPSLLLKVWIYGYLNHLHSTRGLERACREHLSLLWLTGLNTPDHNTLWRFWSANKTALRATYIKSIQIAARAGLVGMTLQALDGTKIEAACSGHTGWSKKYMEKLLVQLNQALDQAEDQVQKNQASQSGEYRLPQSLSERQALQAEIEKGLQQLKETGREHYHPKDPQAQRMKCSGKNRFGYNGQAVADSKAGVVVACELINQETDKGQLGPMLDQARENLQIAAQNTPAQSPTQPISLADTGYGASEDLAQAQAQGHELLVTPCGGNLTNKTIYHNSNFVYDKDKDVCICPQGKELPKASEKKRRGGLKVYRCLHKDCPMRDLCTRDKKGRSIEIGPHYDTVVAMRQKLTQPANKEIFKKRSVIIEPVFARVKELLKLRRWTFRGMESVRTQWNFVCLTLNLLILRTCWRMGTLEMG